MKDLIDSLIYIHDACSIPQKTLNTTNPAIYHSQTMNSKLDELRKAILEIQSINLDAIVGKDFIINYVTKCGYPPTNVISGTIYDRYEFENEIYINYTNPEISPHSFLEIWHKNVQLVHICKPIKTLTHFDFVTLFKFVLRSINDQVISPR